jgi:hypothetical protein
MGQQWGNSGAIVGQQWGNDGAIVGSKLAHSWLKGLKTYKVYYQEDKKYETKAFQSKNQSAASVGGSSGVSLLYDDGTLSKIVASR